MFLGRLLGLGAACVAFKLVHAVELTSYDFVGLCDDTQSSDTWVWKK
jgi:hypothetical protein